MINLQQPEPSLKNFFYDWVGMNEWIFHHVNMLRGDIYDMFMILVSHFSRSELFPYYFAAIAAYFVVIATSRRFSGKAGGDHFFGMWVGVLVTLAASFGLEVIFVKVLKIYLAMPRPYEAITAYHVNVVGAEAEATDPNVSFPSGHVTFITGVVLSLWPQLSNRLRYFGLFLIALVGWSRMSLGVHFPVDLMGGVLIAIISVTIARMTTIQVLKRFFGMKC